MAKAYDDALARLAGGKVETTDVNDAGYESAKKAGLPNGVWGTCPWYVTNDKVLHIGAGIGEDVVGTILDEDGVPMGCPWPDDIVAVEGPSKGTVVCPAQMDGLFYECRDLSDVSGLAKWDTSGTVDMSHMFYGCGVFDMRPLRKWDTENLRYIDHMFDLDTYEMQEIDATPISEWDMSNLTSADGLFPDNTLMIDGIDDIARKWKPRFFNNDAHSDKNPVALMMPAQSHATKLDNSDISPFKYIMQVTHINSAVKSVGAKDNWSKATLDDVRPDRVMSDDGRGRMTLAVDDPSADPDADGRRLSLFTVDASKGGRDAVRESLGGGSLDIAIHTFRDASDGYVIDDNGNKKMREETRTLTSVVRDDDGAPVEGPDGGYLTRTREVTSTELGDMWMKSVIGDRERERIAGRKTAEVPGGDTPEDDDDQFGG